MMEKINTIVTFNGLETFLLNYRFKVRLGSRYVCGQPAFIESYALHM